MYIYIKPLASIFVPSIVITILTQHESNTAGMSHSQLNPMNNINCDHMHGNNSKIDSVSSTTTAVNNSLKSDTVNTLKRIRISNVN